MNDLVAVDGGAARKPRALEHNYWAPRKTDHVRFVVVASPMSIDREVFDLPACGATLRELLVATGNLHELPGIFIVNGHIESDRGRVTQPGDHIVFRIRPGVVAIPIIIALAASAATPAIAGGIGAAATALGFSLGPAAAGIIAAGLAQGASMILKLAFNALVPPPSAPKSAPATSPASFSISGGSNQSVPYAPDPKVYGVTQTAPMLAGQSYTEVFGNDQYYRVLLSCGYGPVDMRKLQLANTLLQDYEDIMYEIRNGYPDDAPLQLYSNDVEEQDINVLLLDTGNKNTVPTGWQTQTSGTQANQLSIDFTAPDGLQTINNVGNRRRLTVFLQLRFAPTGTTNWTYVDVDGNTSADPLTISMSATTGDAVRKSIIWPVSPGGSTNGQYDVQTQVTYVTWLPNRDVTTDTFYGTMFWTALRTIIFANPINLPGTSKIALRIRATNQLNGQISQLFSIASSILPDYDPVSGLWDNYAGSWDYNWDVMGAGASGYALDTKTPYNNTGAALAISVAGANDRAGVASRVIPTLGWSWYKLNVSAWYKSNVATAHGVTLKVLFGQDDQFQAATWPDWQPNTAYAVGTIITPTANNAGPFSGLDGVAGYTFQCVVAGTSGATAPAWNQAIDGLTSDGVTVDMWENIGGPPLTSTSIVSSGPATTEWQQVTGTVIVPANTTVQWNNSTAYFPGDVVVGSNGLKYIAVAPNVHVNPTTDGGHNWQVIPVSQYILTGSNFARVVVYNDQPGVACTIEWDAITASMTPAHVLPWNSTTAYIIGEFVSVGGDTYQCVFNNTNENPVNNTTFWLLTSAAPNSNVLANGSFDTAGVITSNPASHYLDVLTSAANKQAVTVAEVDLPMLETWHAYAAENGYLFNGVLDKPSSADSNIGTVDASLRAIAAVGRAAYSRNNNLYSVVLDQPQTTPVQVFTPKNIISFKGHRAFTDLPQCLKVRFKNPNKNYAVDEEYCYWQGYGPVAEEGIIAATVLETLDETLGVVSYDGVQPWRDAQYHLAQAWLRPDTYTLTTYLEQLACKRGDLVYVNHDVPSWGIGSGRIKAVTLNSEGLVSAIKTDEILFGDGTATYAVMVRNNVIQFANSTITNVIPTTGTNLLTLATPLEPSAACVGNLLVFGKINSVANQCLVTAVVPSSDLTAELTLVDYVPAVYEAELQPMPAFVSGQIPTVPPAAPVIAGVRSDVTVMTRQTDGSYA